VAAVVVRGDGGCGGRDGGCDGGEEVVMAHSPFSVLCNKLGMFDLYAPALRGVRVEIRFLFLLGFLFLLFSFDFDFFYFGFLLQVEYCVLFVLLGHVFFSL